MNIISTAIKGELHHLDIKIPVGELWACADDEALLALCWDKAQLPSPSSPASKHTILCAVAMQLTHYFKHERIGFDVPLKPQGSAFQRAAWKALTQIPYGETISYQEQAERIGNPKAVRAVGAANGRNPIPIIIPCHRVIGKDGSLTGFAAGVDMKKKLLSHEQLSMKVLHNAA